MFRSTLLLALAIPLAAKLPLLSTVVVTSEHVEVGANATVTINGSTGELDIQGWDEPRVEVTATKSVYRETKEEGLRELNRVQVKLANKGDAAEINTVLPARSFFIRPFRGRTNATIQTVIRVPRGAHLLIHHESGDVRLREVSGAIEVNVHAGDLQLWVADPKQYQIDAQCNVGGVSSDFDGKFHGRFPTGDSFVDQVGDSAPHARLRVGVGGIQILKAK